MSSRDPDELREELEDIEFTTDPELLPELCSEARETVEGQKETLNDIDTKASRILRLNVLLISVIVSALSFAAQNGGGPDTTLPGVGPFVNLYMKLGVTSLILSTALAAVTYTASELDVGVNSENLTTLLQADMPLDDAQELLVKNYVVRINFNRSTNVRNIPLITSTIVFLVVAVVLFSLGVYEAVVDSVPLWLLVLAALLITCVVVLSGLFKQTWRAIQDFREWR